MKTRNMFKSLFLFLALFCVGLISAEEFPNLLGDDFGGFEAPVIVDGDELDWAIDSAGMVDDKFTIIDTDAATGSKCLRYFYQGKPGSINANSPMGFLNLPKGKYIVSAKFKKTFGSMVNSIGFRTLQPFAEARFNSIASMPLNEWVTLTAEIELKEDGSDSTIFAINMRDGFFPDGEENPMAELKIDDIKIIEFKACVPEQGALINTCLYDFESKLKTTIAGSVFYDDWKINGTVTKQHYSISSEHAYSGQKSLKFVASKKPAEQKTSIFGPDDSFKGLPSGKYKFSMYVYIVKNACMNRVRIGPDRIGTKVPMMNVNFEGMPTEQWVKYEETFVLYEGTDGDGRMKFYTENKDDFTGSGAVEIYFDKLMIEPFEVNCADDDPNTFTDDCFWGFETPMMDNVGWDFGKNYIGLPWAKSTERAKSGDWSLKLSNKKLGTSNYNFLQTMAPAGCITVPPNTRCYLEMDVYKEAGCGISSFAFVFGNPIDIINVDIADLEEGTWSHVKVGYTIPARGTDAKTKQGFRCYKDIGSGTLYIDNFKITKRADCVPDPERLINSCVYDFSGAFVNDAGVDKYWFIPGNDGSTSYLKIKELNVSQTGGTSLRYKAAAGAQASDAIAFAPNGSLDLAAGSYDMLFKVWVQAGSTVDTFTVTLDQPFQQIQVPVEIDTDSFNTWQLLRVPFSRDSASGPTDRMRITFNKDNAGEGANILFIDRIMVVAAGDPEPQVSLSIKPLEVGDTYQVYPNPCDGVLNIEAKEVRRVAIYSMNGQLIRHTVKRTEPFQLDVYDLKAGIYFLRLESDNRAETKIFQVE